MKDAKTEAVLKDYIRWRGDLPFSVVPLNEVDSAILSELAYVDFSQILAPMNPVGITLREAYEAITKKNCYRLLTAQGGQEDFVEEAANSFRFGSLELIRYTDVLDRSSTQFSAITFRITDDTDFVAFRGTDNTIIGWKEDFMMSFTRIPGQDLAARYLMNTMRPDRKYYVGGHSKGANLAVFAVSSLDEQKRAQVIHVFSLDGPGFCPEVYDLSKITAIDPIVTRIVPAYDVIGQLFRRKVNNLRIIRSIQSGILQHDLVSWRVDGPNFSLTDRLDPAVSIINETIRQWLSRADAAARETFVNEFFDSLAAGGALRMEEIIDPSGLSEVVRAFARTSQQTREVALDLPKSAITSSRILLNEFMDEFEKKHGKSRNREEKEK